ncbi:hypothetical protein GO730_21285 [Spirosoma sp. HMF3257]|nr:hypothetical protein [Spirosoma telluris]
METNQQPTAIQNTPEVSAHERAVAIMKRLVADKRQAEKDIVENFHKDPLIQAAVAELKRRRDERGTAAI